MTDGDGRMVAGGPFTSGADGVAATATLIDYDGGKFDRWVYACVPGKLPGGEPVEGVGVAAVTPDNFGLRLGWSVTDPQGRFSMRLANGKTKLHFNRVPSGFVYPEPQVVTIIEVAPDDAGLTKLRLEVPRAK